MNGLVNEYFMNDSIKLSDKKDSERKERLHEWFKSDPEIWKDIEEDIKISYNNELVQLKNRTCTNREWSSGYVAGQEFILEIERYYRKTWIPEKKKI